MQQRFGADERFRLDERFAFEEEDSHDGITVENDNEGADMIKEKKRNMDVLESILGKPIFHDDAGKRGKEYGFAYIVIYQIILFNLLFFFNMDLFTMLFTNLFSLISYFSKFSELEKRKNLMIHLILEDYLC